MPGKVVNVTDFAERKRVRVSFSESDEIANLPHLVAIQINSYAGFLQKNVDPLKREDKGLQAVLSSTFPIKAASGVSELQFLHYELGDSEYSTDDCKLRGFSFVSPLRAMLRMVRYEKDDNGNSFVANMKDQSVFMGDLPVMTDSGSFIINGTERVIVSQLHRSPGAYFDKDRSRATGSAGSDIYARLIPERGVWFDVEFDGRNNVFARIDRRRKIPVTVVLRAMGMDIEGILSCFFDSIPVTIKEDKFILDFDVDKWIGDRAPCDIVNSEGEMIVEQGKNISGKVAIKTNRSKVTQLELSAEQMEGRILKNNIIDTETGEILVEANTVIDVAVCEQLCAADVVNFECVLTNEANRGSYISSTLRVDSNTSTSSALADIYRVMRPGEPPAKDAAETMFNNMFFSSDRYDLSTVGRMKLDKRLGRDFTREEQDERPLHLEKEDIIDVIKELIFIRDGDGRVDDIDSLANRRVRCVGEMLQNQFRVGVLRVERSIKERIGHPDHEEAMPQDLINSRPISAAIKEFFGTNQLSQFMDQNNPLSAVTHKRRVSALGPGGLTRERAVFEVRDVHHTHYGRICTVETPEGPNIGLINSLAIYSVLNEYGFLETPFYRVINQKVTGEAVYLSAIDEAKEYIAPANVTDGAAYIPDGIVSCRHRGEFTTVSAEKIGFIDVSTKQIVSVAAALIPFLEHDDANRALMGSNMQRQAVPTVNARKPLVGTGMERQVARDSGMVVLASSAGVVKSVDASRIVIETSGKKKAGASDIMIYNLQKFKRSNQNTCLNQTPIIKVGDKVTEGDVIADGSSIDLGELALGQNLRVAFMSWNGYNFEDSILISERLVREDVLASVHIYELVCTARDTKLGTEEVTSDIPNVGDHVLSKLDNSGIVYKGAEVKPGDILVGKVTPKGESQISPEEKLLRAIFGEKASDVKDSSLRVPSGTSGTVINVQVFTRDGFDKDERALAIEAENVERLEKDLKECLNAKSKYIFEEMIKLLDGESLESAPARLEIGSKLSKKDLSELSLDDLIKIKTKDEEINRKSEDLSLRYGALVKDYKSDLAKRKSQIQNCNDLAPGVVKVVKVYLAVKRQIQPGDKLAGRHGNKGVISMIVPEEDMPYDTETGEPVDVLLNPLGVPSRMNIGQIMETHLGWAAHCLGRKIDSMLKKKVATDELRSFISKIMSVGTGPQVDILSWSDADILELAGNYRLGVPMSSPVFSGVKEDQLRKLFNLADLDESGKSRLVDGRTGDEFECDITVGYMYVLKLNHLVDDKMHARSTGSYSLVTQQPLGGKAQFGGQRLGEMEVWALEAYGAAYTLQEMLTVKSDDVIGRTRLYKNIIEGDYSMEARVPESFRVLMREIRSLGINIELTDSRKEQR